MRSSISNKSRVGEEHLVGSLFLLMQNVDSVYHLFIGGGQDFTSVTAEISEIYLLMIKNSPNHLIFTLALCYNICGRILK